MREGEGEGGREREGGREGGREGDGQTLLPFLYLYSSPLPCPQAIPSPPRVRSPPVEGHSRVLR